MGLNISVNASCSCDKCGKIFEGMLEVVDWDTPTCVPEINEDWAHETLREAGWKLNEPGEYTCEGCEE